MNNVVIVDAVRTPIGRRGGGLSTVHPAKLLGVVQQAITKALHELERTGREIRPGHHVLRWRNGHRHDHRAPRLIGP